MKKTILTTTFVLCSVLIASCGNSSNSASQQNQANTSTATKINSELTSANQVKLDKNEPSQKTSNPTSSEKASVKTKEISNDNPSFGTIKDMQNGDLKCYVTVVDRNGKLYESLGATFDVCEPDKYVNKNVYLSYKLENVNDCQSAEPCGKTIEEWLISKIEIRDEKSQNSSNGVTPISQASKELAAGEYCYTAKTETLSANAKIKVSPAKKLDGSIQATIQNPAEGYFTSYNQTLIGELQRDKAKLKIVTKIENDIQNKQETWIITESSLNTGLETFTKADCGSL